MIETAATERSFAEAVRRAPPHIQRAIARARTARGLPAMLEPTAPTGRGPSVVWDPRSPHRPRGASRVCRTGDRVVMIVAHGDAPAAAIGRNLPEAIARHAFGDTLNSELGWGIVGPTHNGPILALVGPRLRAHDTEVGLALTLDIDPADARHGEVLRLVERGLRPSVLMKVYSRRALPGPVEMVTRARLVNVALVDRPAHAGAVAKVFRNVAIDDTAVLLEQLEAIVRAARFAENRRHGRG